MRGGKTNIWSLLYCAASEVTLALFSSLLKLDGTTDLYTELLGLLLTILFSLTIILMIFSECWRHDSFTISPLSSLSHSRCAMEARMPRRGSWDSSDN